MMIKDPQEEFHNVFGYFVLEECCALNGYRHHLRARSRVGGQYARPPTPLAHARALVARRGLQLRSARRIVRSSPLSPRRPHVCVRRVLSGFSPPFGPT